MCDTDFITLSAEIGCFWSLDTNPTHLTWFEKMQGLIVHAMNEISRIKRKKTQSVGFIRLGEIIIMSAS